LISDPQAVSKEFCTHFQKIYPDTSANSVRPFESLGKVEITNADVDVALKELKVMKSVGPDGIPSVIIKVYGELLIQPFCISTMSVSRPEDSQAVEEGNWSSHSKIWKCA